MFNLVAMARRVALKKITDDTELEFEGTFIKISPVKAIKMDEAFTVDTLEGDNIKGKAGDYLCEGKAGERWPIDAEIFEKTYKKEARHAQSKCMDCAKPPTHECRWANGKGRAWFCDACWTKWSKEHAGDIDTNREVVGGMVGKKYGEDPKKGKAKKAGHKFPEYRNKSRSWLLKERERVDRESNPVGYGPKPVNEAPSSVSKPELFERLNALRTELGQQWWQRTWSEVKGRGIPKRKHREQIEKALRRGEDVPKAVLEEYGMSRRAAQVGTDTATIFAIAPEMLKRVVDKAVLARSWAEWADHFEEIENLVRTHGGAVFHTGGDGLWDVVVSGGPGDLDVPIEGEGFLPPYNTPEFGGNSVGMVPQNRVASGYQARVVIAAMKAAGWWQIKPQGTGGIWWDSNDEDLPESAERYNGDGPADMMGDFLDQLDIVYRQSWGRPAYPEELKGVFDFVFGPVGDKSPEEHQQARGYQSWPLNAWVDATTEATGYSSKAVASLPEQERKDLAKYYREYKTEGFNKVMDEKGSVSSEDVVPPSSEKAREEWESNARMLFRHHLTDTLRQYDIDPEAGGTSTVELGIYPTFEAEVSMSKGLPTERHAKVSATRVAFRHLSKTADLGTGDTKGDGHSVGLFIPLPAELAELYPALDGEDDSPSHVTLLYVGEVTPDREADFIRILEGVLATEPGPIRAWIDGVDKFSHPGNNREVFYTPIRFSRDLGMIRDRLTLELKTADFDVKNSFPLAFCPHTTLAYVEGQDMVWEGDVPQGAWEFSTIQVWGLPNERELELGTFTQHDTTFIERQEAGLLQSWGDFLD